MDGTATRTIAASQGGMNVLEMTYVELSDGVYEFTDSAGPLVETYVWVDGVALTREATFFTPLTP